MQRVLNNIWCRDGPVSITSTDSDVFIVHLATDSTRQWILESVPWHVMNRRVVIIKWDFNAIKLDLDLSQFPIFVNLSSVPLELESKGGLSFIASGLGKPMSMDRATSLKPKLH